MWTEGSIQTFHHKIRPKYKITAADSIWFNTHVREKTAKLEYMKAYFLKVREYVRINR